MLELCLEDGRFDSWWHWGQFIASLEKNNIVKAVSAAADGQTADRSLGCGRHLHHSDQHSAISLQSPGFQVAVMWEDTPLSIFQPLWFSAQVYHITIAFRGRWSGQAEEDSDKVLRPSVRGQ